MNVEIGTEAAQFTEKEYINGIFVAVHVRAEQLLIISNDLRDPRGLRPKAQTIRYDYCRCVAQ
jgi:hypothetical protein